MDFFQFYFKNIFNVKDNQCLIGVPYLNVVKYYNGKSPSFPHYNELIEQDLCGKNMPDLQPNDGFEFRANFLTFLC